MKKRLLFLVFLVVIATFGPPDVSGQTTSISYLTYPTTALAGSRADVSFTVTYSTSQPYYLLTGVSSEANNFSYVPGGITASHPFTCMPGLTLLAACATLYTVVGSGSEHVTFTLNLVITGSIDYSHLFAAAMFMDAKAQIVNDSLSTAWFSILTTNTVSPTSDYLTTVTKPVEGSPPIANPQQLATIATILVGGAIIGAYASRRRRKNSWTKTPSNQEATIEKIAYCPECGAPISSDTANFCAQCGKVLPKQN